MSRSASNPTLKRAPTTHAHHTRVIASLAAFALALTPALAPAQLPVLQREFTIGCADCGGALQFSRIDDLALSPRGEFTVVDGEAPFIRQFDSKGKLLWQGGAKGKGPGEYSSIGRVAFLSNGSLAVVDAGGMRVTTLSATHTVLATTPLPAYPTTLAANASGVVLLGAESSRGIFTLSKFQNGALTKLTLPNSASTPAGTPFKGASIAIASNGAIAVMPNDDRYEILRMDSAAAPLTAVTRNIEPTRLSAKELAKQDEISRKIAGQQAEMARAMAATSGRGSGAGAGQGSGGGAAARGSARGSARSSEGSSGAVVNVNPADKNLPFKPHVLVDGLRYDANGRLWVLTMRGNEASTVFDVFAPTGAYVGAVTIPEVVKQFAVGGTSLLTASENADGIPVVTKWSVR